MSNFREHEYEDDNGETQIIRVPQKWEICCTCQGNGKHSHAVDGNGITQSEWEQDWDYEERETYLSGGYDQTCESCNGSGKVLEDDLNSLSEKDRKILIDFWNDEADYNRMCMMERLMGA